MFRERKSVKSQLNDVAICTAGRIWGCFGMTKMNFTEREEVALLSAMQNSKPSSLSVANGCPECHEMICDEHPGRQWRKGKRATD